MDLFAWGDKEEGIEGGGEEKIDIDNGVEEEAYEEVEEEAPKDETEIEVEPHSAVLNGLSMLIVFFRLMLFKF
uniref:Uncharacterized protein n=1 Tax=Solanum tuberosum TaxID=4113 RepID=M1BU71_SOLTU